ncbi:agmatine deiminase family protein [Kitasatospora sp. CM 4170]|uniref:Agmatine/peptidylarginine deiminase n=1 Tax=Kitasatospora aburaviensis TaxID=67265 RepID=A0ABW1F6C6_9ACTN|nr:agmatine deiminase family protein [Kitasatospora sp. CM 4170]WNM49171.1 agmatine deiminase family protein [Kitasatospora sp. CM 4170]
MNGHDAPHVSSGRVPGAIGRRGLLAATGLAVAGTALGANGARAALRAAAPATPAASAAGTFAVPVDTVAHTRTWMAWPDDPAIWTGRRGGRRGGTTPSLAQIQANIALVANTIAKYEPVYLCANPAAAAGARRACPSANITVITTVPVNDCWMRDSGPVFRTDGLGGLDAIGLNFNGWGGNQTYTNDGKVAARVAALVGVPFTAAGLVAEGGAIETDGAGTLMATRSSILVSNRNPAMTQARAEAAMTAAYGASKVIWFTGVAGQDITGDHVDATSRFLAPGRGLVQQPNATDDPSDVWTKDELNQYSVLSAATDARGVRIQATKLGGPDYYVIRQSDPYFVGSYANYYVCNGAVIASQFGDSRADAAAKAKLQSLFPGRVVEQLNVDYIGLGGGGIHCVTQQQPKP